MTKSPSTNGSVFRMLCRVLGGQDQTALRECISKALLPQLFNMAHSENLLPALAVSCNEQNIDTLVFGEERAGLLKQALVDNAMRNMEIIAQALKFTRLLNRAGITPLFLKGTAQLLTSESENIGFRKQIDIDLIVEPAELEAAGDALLADGYRFCKFPDNFNAVPIMPGDTVNAITLSAAHHHLPPLVKSGYAATVELHRHFLDKRFQRGNPLEALFSNALLLERHGVTFFVPSCEHQIIHLVLGKFVNDGHLARRTFPIKDACDLINILEGADRAVEMKLVQRQCGRSFTLFYSLVCELMNYYGRIRIAEFEDTSKYTWMMQKSFESQFIREVLDAYARTEYLARALAYNPKKLPGYLRRLTSSN